ARLDEAKRVVEAREKTWAEAERAWMRAAGSDYNAAQTGITSGTKYDESAATMDLHDANDKALAAWQEARELQGEVMVEKTRIERRVYARADRRMKRDTEPEPATAPADKSWRDRLKAAVTTSSAR
ncbi:MAG: hypothetical protein IH937_08495, partial [Acidobacteria bacterium]|nr:hypothetical protein [Acidobacteriota bacterium]